MKSALRLTFTTLLLAASSLSAATHYVSPGSTNPTPPYTNWATAAANIQQAVNVAGAGDTLVVTNGIYPGGVTVAKPLALLSVNGPQPTVIDGGGKNQCVSLTDGASLSGFTLTNGHLSGADGGGVGCTSVNAFLTNCLIIGNWAGNGGGASGGTLYNCTLSGNSVDTNINNGMSGAGGGANSSTLYNCTLAGNSAKSGGGAAFCTLHNCTLSSNSAVMTFGGGAGSSTLYNCMLTGNSANGGGGAGTCRLYNCTLTGNSAGYQGGGASGSVLYNCTLTGNWADADQYGGLSYGGGASGCTLYNCIAYFNTASGGANYDAFSTLNYCCTTPLPPGGTGNIALDPQLASATYLGAHSPCIGAGSAAYATGTDIDEELWGNPPSIGCDEYHAGAVTGPLTVSLLATYTNVEVGYSVAFTALIEGRTTESVWSFGDGIVVSNQPYANHAWVAPGEYAVVLRAYNESLPGGVSAVLTVHVVQEAHYAAASSANPQQPYTSWGTAATNIQDAVDAATAPGVLVLVSNGVYAGGLVVDMPLTLRSVNGPEFTVIDGGNPCVSLTNGVSLTGFTLTKGNFGVTCASTNAFLTNCVITGNSVSGGRGGTLYNCTVSGNSGRGVSWSVLYNCTLTDNSFSDDDGGGAYLCTLYNCTLTRNWVTALQTGIGGHGGGAYECTLYNCTLTGNSARVAQNGSAGYGGGASYCTLYNCTLTDNSASGGDGGGAYNCTLYNCTLTSNSANVGGGASVSTLNNCIVYYNTASNGGANYDSYGYSTLNYCCTMLLPTNGVGNITNGPLFVDYASGNLRLQSNSPCINAGNNLSLANLDWSRMQSTSAWFTNRFDLDGNPRVVSGTVDIGAYEYQGTGSLISYAWLQQYGLPTDGSADYADPDHDGLDNWQEWVCGTNPTNAQSVLRLVSATPAGTNITVTWQSVVGVNYLLERSGNLASPLTLLATNIVGQAGTTSYADTNGSGAGPFFYRVGVKSP